MLTNRKEWDVQVHFSALEMATIFEEIPYIPAVSFKGALRHVLDTRDTRSDLVQDLFGDNQRPGLMVLSDLRLLPEAKQPELSIQLQVAIDPKTGVAVTDRLYERKVMHDACFSGKVLLRNGGTYPSVFAHKAIHKSLPYLRIGRRNAHGVGLPQDCHFKRLASEAGANLNPIEQIFRQSTHAAIETIASHPELVYSLEWRDIERLMALVYEEIGFSVSLTKASQDGGKDLVMYCLSGPSSHGRKPLKYYVELKHWKKGTRVGTEPVNKLLQISVRDGASGSIFLSTSGFTANVGKDLTSRQNPFLGDLSTIHTLCRFYVASRNNELFSSRALEEIVNLKTENNGKAQQGATADL
jgi:Restriction endonuclease/RAMP superfamily